VHFFFFLMRHSPSSPAAPGDFTNTCESPSAHQTSGVVQRPVADLCGRRASRVAIGEGVPAPYLRLKEAFAQAQKATSLLARTLRSSFVGRWAGAE
jgi:hypothetical protein